MTTLKRTQSLKIASSPRARKINLSPSMKTASSLTSINGKSTSSKCNGSSLASSLKQGMATPASPKVSKTSVLPKVNKDASTLPYKTSGTRCTTISKIATNSSIIKSHTSQTARETVQRLTNGIPVAKGRQQRRFSLDITSTSSGSKASAESSEPKSILKKTSRRSSISNGETGILGFEPSTVASFGLSQSLLSLSQFQSQDSLAPSPTLQFNGDMASLHESHPVLSEHEILKNCSYRLDAEPVNTQDIGSKKVTFEDDVIVFRKQNKRRYSVPSIK